MSTHPAPPSSPLPNTGFCGKCGSQNALTEAFCSHCGAALSWASQNADAISPSAPPPVMPPVMPPPPPMPPAMVPPPPPPSATALPPTAPPPPSVTSQPSPMGTLNMGTLQSAPTSAIEPGPLPLLESPLLERGQSFGRALLEDGTALVQKRLTPGEFLGRYALALGAGLFLVGFAVFQPSLFFGLLFVGALVGLALGLKDPQRFRFVFGGKTSKSTVGWTFGVLAVLLANLCASLEPKPDVSPAEQAAKSSAQRARDDAKRAQERARDAEQKAAQAQKQAREAERARQASQQRADKTQRSLDAQRQAQKSRSDQEAQSSGSQSGNSPAPNTNSSNAANVPALLAGVKTSKEDAPVEPFLTVENLDSMSWGKTTIYLNYDLLVFLKRDEVAAGKNYAYTIGNLTPGQTVTIPLNAFRKESGRRFNPGEFAVQRIFIESDTPRGRQTWDGDNTTN